MKRLLCILLCMMMVMCTACTSASDSKKDGKKSEFGKVKDSDDDDDWDEDDEDEDIDEQETEDDSDRDNEQVDSDNIETIECVITNATGWDTLIMASDSQPGEDATTGNYNQYNISEKVAPNVFNQMTQIHDMDQYDYSATFKCINIQNIDKDSPYYEDLREITTAELRILEYMVMFALAEQDEEIKQILVDNVPNPDTVNDEEMLEGLDAAFLKAIQETRLGETPILDDFGIKNAREMKSTEQIVEAAMTNPHSINTYMVLDGELTRGDKKQQTQTQEPVEYISTDNDTPDSEAPEATEAKPNTDSNSSIFGGMVTFVIKDYKVVDDEYIAFTPEGLSGEYRIYKEITPEDYETIKSKLETISKVSDWGIDGKYATAKKVKSSGQYNIDEDSTTVYILSGSKLISAVE